MIDNLKCAAFIAVVGFVVVGFWFGMLYPKSFIVHDGTRVEIAATLGDEWRALEKGDLLVLDGERTRPILGAHTGFNGPVLTVQARPGWSFFAMNRGEYSISWLLKYGPDFELVRRTDPRYERLRQQFESRKS